ncbi:MAG: penicillin-binding protein 2 [Myxococcaceae bacterium]
MLGGFFLFGLTVLALNLYRLMVVRYEEFRTLSVDNQFKDKRVRAPRGQIKDVRGEVLVDARPSYDLTITPAFCQKCVAEVIPQLAELLHWDEATRQKIIASVRAAHGPQRYQPMTVQVDLTDDERDRVEGQLRSLYGCDVEAVPHRHYKAGTALAHVLGYMNEVEKEELSKLNERSDEQHPTYHLGDYIGRRGVERAYEGTLHGKDGWRKEIVNARGEVLRDSEHAEWHDEAQDVAPVPGNNVVLSIDARLQAEAERVFPGQAGAVVAVDPKTGFILAMLSHPAFDPNQLTGRVSSQQLSELVKDPLQPMVFRPVAEQYHPGSTFKPITLLAALHAGAITPQTTINCPGGYQLGNRRWRCDLERGHGGLQARAALAMSCDVYFYRLGDLLGINPIAAQARDLGLGTQTNFDIAAEVTGIIPDEAFANKVIPGGYTKGQALNTAIGQGDVNVTPLQLAMMYSAFANGGTLFTPQVVKKIESPGGQVLKEFAPKMVRQINMSPEEHELLMSAMTAVVNEPGGTAYRAHLKDVTVAGKTGTAQVMRIGEKRLKKEEQSYLERDHAWFASFAPAEHPEVVVVVLNEHSGFGGREAAPAAAAIIEKYMELKRLEKDAFGPSFPPVDNKTVKEAPKSSSPPPPLVPEAPKKESVPALTDASDAGQTLSFGRGPTGPQVPRGEGQPDSHPEPAQESPKATP